MKETEQGCLSLLFTGTLPLSDIEDTLSSALPVKYRVTFLSVVRKAIKENKKMVGMININIFMIY